MEWMKSSEDVPKPSDRRTSSFDHPRCRGGGRLIGARGIVGGRRASPLRTHQGADAAAARISWGRRRSCIGMGCQKLNSGGVGFFL
jgi:hypothetical protein